MTQSFPPPEMIPFSFYPDLNYQIIEIDWIVESDWKKYSIKIWSQQMITNTVKQSACMFGILSRTEIP